MLLWAYIAKLAILPIIVASIWFIAIPIFFDTSDSALATTKDFAEDVFGLGGPVIESFSVIVDPQDDKNFRVNFKINANRVLEEDFSSVGEVIVFRQYRKYVDDTVDDPIEVLSIKDVNDIAVLSEASGVGEKYIAIIDDNDDADDNLWLERAGIHTFTIILKPAGGGEDDDAEDELRLYDDVYLETYDSKIDGCAEQVERTGGDGIGNLNLHKCNVVDCKKDTFQMMVRDKFATCYDPVVDVLLEVSKEFKISEICLEEPNGQFCELTDCGSISFNDASTKSKSIAYTDLALCKPKQIDEFNKMSVRVWLMFFACANPFGDLDEEDSGIDIRSEADYAKLSASSFEKLKQRAISRTMACVNGFEYGTKGDVLQANGLKSHLLGDDFEGIGFEGGDDDARIGVVAKKLDDALGILPSTIGDIRALGRSDGTIKLEWQLPTGKDNIDSYDLKIFYSNTLLKKPRDLDQENFDGGRGIVFDQIVNMRLPDMDQLSVTYPEGGTLNSDQMGVYWFVLRVLDGRRKVVDKGEAVAGIYDNNFVELYRYNKNIDDGCKNCDVILRKEDALGDNDFGHADDPNDPGTNFISGVLSGHDEDFNSRCFVVDDDEGEERIVSCNNEQVDLLYEEVLDARYAEHSRFPGDRENILKIDCASEMDWIDDFPYRATGIKEVCDAKKALLDKIDWWTYTRN